MDVRRIIDFLEKEYMCEVTYESSVWITMECLLPGSEWPIHLGITKKGGEIVADVPTEEEVYTPEVLSQHGMWGPEDDPEEIEREAEREIEEWLLQPTEEKRFGSVIAAKSPEILEEDCYVNIPHVHLVKGYTCSITGNAKSFEDVKKALEFCLGK